MVTITEHDGTRREIPLSRLRRERPRAIVIAPFRGSTEEAARQLRAERTDRTHRVRASTSFLRGARV